jgi:hypothetical protein
VIFRQCRNVFNEVKEYDFNFWTLIYVIKE